MIPFVYDGPEGDGVDLVFDLENGLGIAVFLSEEGAQDLIDQVQNKLNGHWKKGGKP